MDLSVEMKKKTALTLAALPAAERSEPELGEGERSGAAGKAGAVSIGLPHPDPEVVAKPRRRAFTAEYKRRILNEADAARFSGTIGALLRREGLIPPIWSLGGASGTPASWKLSRPRSAARNQAPSSGGRKPEAAPPE
ncbi:MAG: hypothetical protein IPM24_04640 [Bryobacterales bacterium]|nr:hypothetical protein [Bryobacterales bacterium]